MATIGFACPALAIRYVSSRPGTICPLPMTDAVLEGVAHEQREFIPLFSFGVARGLSHEGHQEKQMLVVSGDAGPWGLLVDEVIGLETLELSLNAQRGQPASWSGATIGSTSFRDQFVTAIDAQSLNDFLQRRLNDSWKHVRLQAHESRGTSPLSAPPTVTVD